MPIIRRTRPCCCVHTACDTPQHNHSQHKQCKTPYAVIHGIYLLMMGIMMTETCWDRSLIINKRLFAYCWFFFLSLSLSSPYVQDACSQEPKICHKISWKSIQCEPINSIRTNRRTDRQRDTTKLVVYFRNFGNVLRQLNASKDEAQTALFKDPVRTAL